MLDDRSRATFTHPAQATRGESVPSAVPRRLVLLANGRRHGPITRLITPWGIGELTRPFVLLNYAEAERRSRRRFGIHPPSAVTTLTVVLNGVLSFEDAIGKRGEVAAGGLACMN